MKWHRWAIATVAAFSLLGICKPAVIRTDHDTRLAVFFRWQSGEIRFVNSVTGRPVSIGLHIGRRFQAFSVITDETTEAYYTNGTYDMNTRAAQESTDQLRFCSMKGISLRLGFYTYSIKDGCLEVTLLWTLW
jgi:hypothetical protein